MPYTQDGRWYPPGPEEVERALRNERNNPGFHEAMREYMGRVDPNRAPGWENPPMFAPNSKGSGPTIRMIDDREKTGIPLAFGRTGKNPPVVPIGSDYTDEQLNTPIGEWPIPDNVVPIGSKTLASVVDRDEYGNPIWGSSPQQGMLGSAVYGTTPTTQVRGGLVSDWNPYGSPLAGHGVGEMPAGGKLGAPTVGGIDPVTTYGIMSAGPAVASGISGIAQGGKALYNAMTRGPFDQSRRDFLGKALEKGVGVMGQGIGIGGKKAGQASSKTREYAKGPYDMRTLDDAIAAQKNPRVTTTQKIIDDSIEYAKELGDDIPLGKIIETITGWRGLSALAPPAIIAEDWMDPSLVTSYIPDQNVSAFDYVAEYEEKKAAAIEAERVAQAVAEAAKAEQARAAARAAQSQRAKEQAVVTRNQPDRGLQQAQAQVAEAQRVADIVTRASTVPVDPGLKKTSAPKKAPKITRPVLTPDRKPHVPNIVWVGGLNGGPVDLNNPSMGNIAGPDRWGGGPGDFRGGLASGEGAYGMNPNY